MKRTHGLVVFLLTMLCFAPAAYAQTADARSNSSKSNSSVLRDGQGNPIHTSSGGCISFPGEDVTDPACLPEKEPDRIRITTIGVEPDYAGEALNPPKGRNDGQVAVTRKTLHFVTDTPFGLNSAGLTDAMRRNMLAFLISLEPYFKVTNLDIIGHSDASGSAHYNQWLSEKRAESVRIYFRSLGVDPRMMTIRGAGETALLPTLEPTAAGQRRVEITAQVQEKP
ncbi:MAG TPA: OmpA family protein [Gammaproteobacteria bacterium]|nr:OmpA family protein [Gammaproteobacteria bacterium]